MGLEEPLIDASSASGVHKLHIGTISNGKMWRSKEGLNTFQPLVRFVPTSKGTSSKASLKQIDGGRRSTERSVFKIIFVKLANFRANISETQDNFLRSSAQSAGSVGKMLQWRSTKQ